MTTTNDADITVQGDCGHSRGEQFAACQDGACPICLEDKLRLLQLTCSVKPPNEIDAMVIARLKQEVQILWKVIALLGGRE